MDEKSDYAGQVIYSLFSSLSLSLSLSLSPRTYVCSDSGTGFYPWLQNGWLRHGQREREWERERRERENGRERRERDERA